MVGKSSVLFNNLGNQELLQGRLLYTALIKAVLIAWNNDCPIANSYLDVVYLNQNQELIIQNLMAYFCPEGLSSKDSEKSFEISLPSEAVQLLPVFRAIALLHLAVANSTQPECQKIAGYTEFETMKNLILFFEEQKS